MVCLKSLLVGLLTLVGASFLLAILGIVGFVIYAMIHSPVDGAVGWDPISLWRRPRLLLIAFAIVSFSAGFLWEYRRVVR